MNTESPTPRLLLQPKAWKRFAEGAPWAFSNEIQMDNAARKLAPGTLARLCLPEGEPAALVHFNPHSLIAARALSREPDHLAAGALPADWLEARIERAAALRARLFEEPYYRLVHAEADGLPGLVIDRFGDIFTVQANTAGMDRLLPRIDAALTDRLGATAIVHRNDSATRGLEGLAEGIEVARGTLDGPVTLRENGALFHADLSTGQKTGWFFDHRENRAFAARLAKGRSVLDLYGYAGAFAIPAALAGATRVVGIDRSAEAQVLAARSAEANGVADRITFERADVFQYLERLETPFDLVIADPPAFVKNRKSLKQGLRAYAKLARLSAGATAPGGELMLASCSHLVSEDAFLEACRQGLKEAGREARLIRRAGAGPDHPLHPRLAESGYLKALFFTLD
ncbi:class I SAM-dependent rRNA methyltransferase [Marivibrio halodurans]|uniref:Class I SAM-dependent rRNA methyltransferase n=1 Tax=Marivibrio halodurans TaxID=2039722 RepID=A0A8J7SP96_9PROT|nr:class I SAM-dependent rRNA methyltransferase [Marivibrio halodurans]MBP5858498.1 class I SAM-dependent rRNA methyltransferase [Marivibrio halodurans]